MQFHRWANHRACSDLRSIHVPRRKLESTCCRLRWRLLSRISSVIIRQCGRSCVASMTCNDKKAYFYKPQLASLVHQQRSTAHWMTVSREQLQPIDALKYSFICVLLRICRIHRYLLVFTNFVRLTSAHFVDSSLLWFDWHYMFSDFIDFWTFFVTNR